MPHGQTAYQALLDRIRKGFPSPMSDPVHDAYAIDAVTRALDRLDRLKGDTPHLGRIIANDYDRARAATLDDGMRSVEAVIDLMVPYLNGVDWWYHPLQQINVTSPVPLPALIANVLAAMANPNMAADESSRRFAEAEVELSAIVGGMVGYDTSRSLGISTYGGSGAVFYALKLMLAKALPDSAENGVRRDVKIIASEHAHSCKYNAMSWSGLGTKNLVSIPTDADNGILLHETEETVRGLLDAGHTIGGFICTMGTTDAFGVDDIRFIAGLRDRIVTDYRLSHRPHIHADAAIGWAYSVFNDYDFDGNPLGFSRDALRSILDTYLNVRHMNLADSIGIDFHKTGYAPYISTLCLLKEMDDIRHIARSKESIPYVFHVGNYHPGLYTLETSRSATGVFSALANLRFLGKDGFRALLGHPVEMAIRLRKKIEAADGCVLLNRYNFGPVSLFRIYPKGVDARVQYRRETEDSAFADDLERYNDYNRRLYYRIAEESRKGRCAALSLTECYRKTRYGRPIAALKSYITTPFVTGQVIDTLMDAVLALRDEVDRAG